MGAGVTSSKRFAKVLIQALAAAAAAVASSAAAEDAEESETCNALFVHSARSISLDATTLTMEGVSPSVIFFCDRPVRMAGHLSVEEFLSSVSKGRTALPRILRTRPSR